MSSYKKDRAVLFPGQGSQRVGMGADLAREFAPARLVYEEADDALGFPISRLSFEGPEAELTLTANAQPAIVAASIAVLRTLEREVAFTFDLVAGHSLGEWTALVAAGSLSLSDALRLVRLRGIYMQEAVPPGVGTMAAVIGLDASRLTTVCLEAAEGEVVAPANINGAGQIVIAGHVGAVARAMALAKKAGARHVTQLKVSAPFHCSLMAPAAERLAAALEPVPVSAPSVPVVTNVEAVPNEDPGRIKELLVRQVTSPVRWEETVRWIADQGYARALELGPCPVCANLVKRIAPEIKVLAIGATAEIKDLVRLMAAAA